MNLVIIGAGGYGRTVADLAYQSKKYSHVFFLDDSKTGGNIIGKCSDYKKLISSSVEIYPAFGNNVTRLDYLVKLEEVGAKIPTIIHNTAYVSPTAKIEKGCMILPNAIINTDCVVKKGCIINCGAIIDHGCVIEEGVHVCLGAIIKGENRIAKNSKIEAGEIIQLRTYSL